MANPNAAFGTISELSRDTDRGTAVVLADGRTVRFDPADRRAAAFTSILEDLRSRKMPVYIETDPGSGFIGRVHLPKLVRIDRITEEPGGDVSVMFEQSHARHVVKRDSAEAGELLRALREARKEQWLAVTVSDAGEILDVRPFDPPFELPRLEPPPAIRWWQWYWWPWNWWCCVSMSRAQQLFDLCAATTCNPLTVPVPCIPFLYPDDGCWGRAHEMCRLIIADGASPRKVWIDGSLHTPTKNNPNCFVNWGWHVAPTLCVRRWRWWWWFSSQTMVIDPSLFTTPVSEATWKGVQGDPNATLTPTSADVFSRWGGYQPDPAYVQTNIVLANYRSQLQLRSLNIGPPPYANCP